MSALWSHSYTGAYPSYRQDPIQFSTTFCRVSLTVCTLSEWARLGYKSNAECITIANYWSARSRVAHLFRSQQARYWLDPVSTP